jgi:hypothetical protein
MTIRHSLAGVGVIGDFIGAENVYAIMNFRFAMQLVDRTDLFLRSCDYRYLFLVRSRGCIGQAWRAKGWDFGSKQLAGY